MNILLINENPVVSRLLALCTREEHMLLEEVAGVDTIRHGKYDVVFVDEGSYRAEVLTLSDMLSIGKKVLLSNADVEINDFDMSIKKPFLPSQIIEILANIEEIDDVLEVEEIQEMQELDDSEELEEEITFAGTQILDADELEKIKALLDMDDEIKEVQEALSDEEIEIRKIEAIKEQLIADGLEIVGEEDIVDGLSAEDTMVIFSSEENEELSVKKSKKKKKKKEKKQSRKSIEFTEEELEGIEDAVQVAIATLKRKKMKKLLKGKEIEISIKLEDSN